MLILIAGQPGTGKTTLGQLLAQKLGGFCLSTDTLKLLCRSLGYGGLALYDSHSAWMAFGEKNNENIIKGYQAHNKLMEKAVINSALLAIKTNKLLILEGVHITPEVFKKIKLKKIAIYLDLPNTKKHFEIFDKKNKLRNKPNKLWVKNYEAIQLINNYAKKNCEAVGFKIYNSQLPKTLAKQLIKDFKL